MLGGADNPNGELPSYITGADTRQQEKLLPFSDVREELPRGTFAYTDVPTMIIRLRA